MTLKTASVSIGVEGQRSVTNVRRPTRRVCGQSLDVAGLIPAAKAPRSRPHAVTETLAGAIPASLHYL